MEKKGVSAVVVTVLLIMITIAGVSIVYSMIMPMIKDWMNKGKSCFDLMGEISIEKNEYTCYNLTDTKVMISRSSKEVEIKGFVFSLNNMGYEIYDNINTAGVKMFNGSSTLSIPKRGEAKTYIFNLSASFVELAPMLPDGKICDAISEKIDVC